MEAVPAGTRLIVLGQDHQSVNECKLYLESDATRFAADEQSRVITLDREVFLNRENWPMQTVYQATSLAQLEQLISSSEPYSPKQRPRRGPRSIGLDEESLAVLQYQAYRFNVWAEVCLELFIVTHLTDTDPMCQTFLEQHARNVKMWFDRQ